MSGLTAGVNFYTSSVPRVVDILEGSPINPKDIDELMTWAETEEGWGFWHDLYNKLQNDLPISESKSELFKRKLAACYNIKTVKRKPNTKFNRWVASHAS